MLPIRARTPVGARAAGVWLGRRRLLVGVLATGLMACIRPPARQAAAPAGPSASEAAWDDQALAVLADALAALRVCETYAAYRMSASARSSPVPIWDPPTSAEWDLARQVADGLRPRADQLFQAIATSPTDPSHWRERRALAAGAHELQDLADALRGYLDRAAHFNADGDGTSGLDLLKTAWTHWDASAMAWSRDRTEPITC